MTFFDRIPCTALLASLATGAAVLAFAAFYVFPRKKKFRYVGKVKKLFFYPVKSCKGIKVDTAECTQLGLKYQGYSDRHWAISTSSGTFLSQRQEPMMALIEPTLNGNKFQLNAPGMELISFYAFPEPNEKNRSNINIWNQEFSSVDLGDEVSKWLSTFLKREGLRMHFSAPSLEKKDCSKKDKKYKYPAKTGDMIAFPDDAAYMMLSQNSIDVVNTKVENPVTVLNFRPNILIEGCQAFDEDAWIKVQIGDATLRALDHCTRCVLTTVDPQKGKKDEKGEPLATLKKFRSKDGYGNSPCFGMFHALDQTGTIKVGDPIYALVG